MDSGVSLVQGALLARGVFVQRVRVLESPCRVDPVSQSLRRSLPIRRRVCSRAERLVVSLSTVPFLCVTLVQCNVCTMASAQLLLMLIVNYEACGHTRQ